MNTCIWDSFVTSSCNMCRRSCIVLLRCWRSLAVSGHLHVAITFTLGDLAKSKRQNCKPMPLLEPWIKAPAAILTANSWKLHILCMLESRIRFQYLRQKDDALKTKKLRLITSWKSTLAMLNKLRYHAHLLFSQSDYFSGVVRTELFYRHPGKFLKQCLYYPK